MFRDLVPCTLRLHDERATVVLPKIVHGRLVGFYAFRFFAENSGDTELTVWRDSREGASSDWFSANRPLSENADLGFGAVYGGEMVEVPAPYTGLIYDTETRLKPTVLSEEDQASLLTWFLARDVDFVFGDSVCLP